MRVFTSLLCFALAAVTTGGCLYDYSQYDFEPSAEAPGGSSNQPASQMNEQMTMGADAGAP